MGKRNNKKYSPAFVAVRTAGSGPRFRWVARWWWAGSNAATNCAGTTRQFTEVILSNYQTETQNKYNCKYNGKYKSNRNNDDWTVIEETRNDNDEGSSCLPVNVRFHQHRSIELFGKCFVGLDVLTHSTAFVTFNDRKKQIVKHQQKLCTSVT